MKVLVIGGGIGGLSACTGIRKYDSQVQITLVEPKDYIEIVWASYRSLFHSETAEASIFPIDVYASKNNIVHIQSTVMELTQHQAKLTNGDQIQFDVAVLAMGASTPYEGFGRGGLKTTSTTIDVSCSSTKAERLKALKMYGKQLLDADTVVIVGGGLVGSELAGDLAVYSRDTAHSTRVIIVHSGNHLCDSEVNEKAGKLLHNKLADLGVKVILNEKAMKTKEGKVLLENSGDTLDADQIIWTTGIEPMNNFLDPGLLNDRGWVDVDSHFQVKGAEGKLFAIGDCCTALPNSGSQILQNIGVIGYNVKAVLDAKKKAAAAGGDGKISPTLCQYSEAAEVYICTVGPDDGIAYTGWCTIDWVLPSFKNWTMFIFEPRNKLGLEQELTEKDFCGCE